MLANNEKTTTTTIIIIVMKIHHHTSLPAVTCQNSQKRIGKQWKNGSNFKAFFCTKNQEIMIFTAKNKTYYMWLFRLFLHGMDEMNRLVVYSTTRLIMGAFHSTKIPVWNFGNFTCLMERYIPVAQTRPKPPRVLSLWLLSTLIITL